MIPAILAAPAAEGIIGSVVGSVAGAVGGLFGAGSSSSSSSSTTAVSPASSAAFNSLLTQAATRAHAAMLNSPIGSMTSIDLDQMSDSDLRTWMMGLTGKQVHAVDAQGHAVSGTVEGYSQTGGTIGLNINGHLLSISNLSQISWSPSVQLR